MPPKAPNMAMISTKEIISFSQRQDRTQIIKGLEFKTTKKTLRGRYSLARAKLRNANEPLRHLIRSKHRFEEFIPAVRLSPPRTKKILERKKLKILRKKAISKAVIASY